jgi:glutaconate CoA-transferase subunit B
MIQQERRYSFDELILTTLSRQLRDKEYVFTGVASPVQMMAVLLAKATHAPNLLYFTLLGSINPTPTILPYSTGDPHLFDRCENAITFPEIFDLANQGRMDVAFLSGAQIDHHGSLNMSIIGTEYQSPKVRLPGGAGGPLMIRSFRRIVSWRPHHSQRCLVKKLPFVTSPGWIPEIQGKRNGGPDVIVTDLCVFKFNKTTHKITLDSLHPNVLLEQVKANTGFTFQIPDEVPQTQIPTKKERELIRIIIDPQKVRKIFLSEPKREE